MTMVVEVPASRRIWFVSDVHLYYGGERYLQAFIEFVELASKSADELWIVGDLFEFWIGRRQGRLPFYEPLLSAFRRLSDGGVRLVIIHGNRDFLMGRAMQDAGAELLPDEVILNTTAGSIHVSHGDQFCIHDRSYQIARRVMRSWPARMIAAGLPVGVGLMLARRYRKISEAKKARKKEKGNGSRFHTIEDGIRELIKNAPADIVLCGHIHDQADRSLSVEQTPVRVVTTGAWEEGPNYVVLSREGLQLRDFVPSESAATPLV